MVIRQPKKSIVMRIANILIALFLTTLILPAAPVEEDYYRMHKIPIPDGIVLEVGGLRSCRTVVWPSGPAGVTSTW